jgi:hypothetical protein
LYPVEFEGGIGYEWIVHVGKTNVIVVAVGSRGVY